ncbi:ABC transporter ATP-binding protein [Candidatus Aerophobetes bacterium]|nr:ABC transporter ATP-binding protein [Candidatus Aerophobetes bacterium]
MMLKVDGVEFSYNSTPVLKGVKFEAEEGEVVVILGPNGAGKSTLLRCMNGILKPRKGVVVIEDVLLESLGIEEIARRTGYVPQNASSNFMSVFDTVLLGRKPHIRWAASEKDFKLVEDTLKLMGIEKFSLKLTRELSGGELQKVILARALVQEPRILLLDEPTNNLDIKNQFEVMRMLNKITHQRNITSIAVMHDINLALRYADRFIAMKNGRIYGEGKREAIDAQLIRKVYGIEVVVDSIRGFPVIVPIWE